SHLDVARRQGADVSRNIRRPASRNGAREALWFRPVGRAPFDSPFRPKDGPPRALLLDARTLRPWPWSRPAPPRAATWRTDEFLDNWRSEQCHLVTVCDCPFDGTSARAGMRKTARSSGAGRPTIRAAR